MAENLRIHAVTPESVDWTSKVQVVDIFGLAESKEKKIKYLNLIIQDEQEDQVKAIVYGDDVLRYQDLLKLYHTYYITEARIQVPSFKYENILSAFDWILDKKPSLIPLRMKAQMHYRLQQGSVLRRFDRSEITFFGLLMTSRGQILTY